MKPYNIENFLEPNLGQKGKHLIALAISRAKDMHKASKTKEKFPGVSTQQYFQAQAEASIKALKEDPYQTSDLRKSDLDLSQYVGGQWVTIDELRERIKKNAQKSFGDIS